MREISRIMITENTAAKIPPIAAPSGAMSPSMASLAMSSPLLPLAPNTLFSRNALSSSIADGLSWFGVSETQR